MPRERNHHDLDDRAWEYIDRSVVERTELACLRAGSDPPWERPHRDGRDITDQPELWTPYQRARREAFEERLARYRSEDRI